MVKIPAESIKVGDVIMPPARELQLWMRRHVADAGLSEAALHLTVEAVREGAPDKRGPWLVFVCGHSEEWNRGRNALSFKFKARPTSEWPIVARNGVVL